MRCDHALAIILALLSSSAAAFEIKTPDTHGFALAVDEHNKAELKSGFQLSFSKGISSLPNNDLLAFLKSLDLKTASGKAVEGLLIDREAGLAIGIARKNVALTLVQSKGTGSDRQLIIAGSDDKGLQIIAPEDVGVFSFNGKTVAYSAVPYEQAKRQTLRVAVLLDVSGSMEGSLSELKNATTAFLKELSSINQGILCRLTSFNSSFRHSGGFVPCGLLISEVAKLQAAGGTELQAPLLSSYQALGKYEDPAAVLIVTDGNAPVDIDALLKAKNASTHALWLGNSFFSRGKYQKLIDRNIYRTGDAGKLASSFFEGFSKSVRGQLVVTIPTKSPMN